MTTSPQVILNERNIKRIWARVAHQIVEKHEDPANLAIVGIQRGGIRPAERLSQLLEGIWGKSAPVGKLDVTMHRDDLDSRAPEMQPTEIPFDVTGRTVILVDDVLFRGRTIRAALDALHALGRPQKVELAVLLDLGGRELPIKADYTGKKIELDPEFRVRVSFREDGNSEDLALAEFCKID